MSYFHDLSSTMSKMPFNASKEGLKLCSGRFYVIQISFPGTLKVGQCEAEMMYRMELS